MLSGRGSTFASSSLSFRAIFAFSPTKFLVSHVLPGFQNLTPTAACLYTGPRDGRLPESLLAKAPAGQGSWYDLESFPARNILP